MSSNYRFSIFVLSLMFGGWVAAQETLTLDECRQRALAANRGLKRAEAKREQTAALEKVALWQMLPKVSANGAYNWTEKTVNLLSEEQKERLEGMGDDLEGDIDRALHDEFSNLNLGTLNIGDAIADRLSNVVANTGLGDRVNGIGKEIVGASTTDTRQVGFAAVTLTQPLYMGGKLLAAYRTARLADALSGVEYDKRREETLIAVDEAYWQVVSVKHKKLLAEQYAALLDTLEHNVQLSVEADVATKGDLARVRVKRNEAQMNLTKATNGLILAKMLLAQRCGMPLDSDFEVSGEWRVESGEWGVENGEWRAENGEWGVESGEWRTESGEWGVESMDGVFERRHELQMLRIADSMAREGVRLAASTLKPNIGITGGYLVSNPNVFNGYKNEWGGTWMAGVAVNVPLLHPGGVYAVKAAKAKRREVAYQMEEAREMIELQVHKLSAELELAYKKLDEAQSNMVQAEENLRLADESFKAGMCSSSDLMMAQTAWLEAKTEVVDTRIEIEMDKVYLRQATGRKL